MNLMNCDFIYFLNFYKKNYHQIIIGGFGALAAKSMC